MDCIVGVGECDNTGSEVKKSAKEAVCVPRCGANCPCDKVVRD